MSINLFNYEFNRILKPTALWTLFICFFIVVDMVLYQEMINSGMFDQIVDMMKNPFIGNMVQAMGVNPDQMTDALGFYAIRNTMITMLIGSIYAVITSSALIAREEYEKTIEFLLSRPVSRFEIITTKLLAFQLNLFLLNLTSSIVGFITLEIFKINDYSHYSYIVLCVNTYLLTLIFSALGLFLSLLMKRGRVFIGAIIGLVLGTYFLEILSKVTESANFIGYISPFKYADKDVLKPGYGFKLWDIIYFVIGTFLLTILSFRIFRKKDVF